MENKPNESNNKSKNFFKKEGFYVILFICLCIVAVVAAITIRNNGKVATNPPALEEQAASNGENNEIANVTKEGLQHPEGAELVKNENNKKKVKITVGEDKGFNVETASVSSSKVLKFMSIDKDIVRSFSEKPMKFDTGSNEDITTYKCNFGVDVKAELGEPVVALLDGKIEFVGNSPKNYGTTVVIEHEGGFKTVYSNLDENIKVKKGEKVEKGQEIGIVGRTTLKTAYEKYGDHLHLAMLKGKGSFQELDHNNMYVDPTDYIEFNKK